MRKFMSLKPERLPRAFDAEIHGEDPIVEVEESEGRIVVSYTFPGFYISDDSRDVDGQKRQAPAALLWPVRADTLRLRLHDHSGKGRTSAIR